MKLLKIIAAFLFAAVLIGLPVAYLAQPDVESNGTEQGASIPQPGVTNDFYPCPTGQNSPKCRPVYSHPDEPRTMPHGIERLLLLGVTDDDDPGNPTTSFLMAFFGVAAAIAGTTLAVQRTRRLVATVLISGGVSLFVAAQVLWQGGDSDQWLGAFALLAVNVAILAGLSFIIFKTTESRRLLTMGILASLIVTTVMIQSGVFYELIGTPEDYCRVCASAIS